MTGLIAGSVERIGQWVHRFLSEVIASVVTTACVAGATTLYLQYTRVAPAPPPAIDTAGIAALLSPIASPLAMRFEPARDAKAEPQARAQSPALPPVRPKLIPRPAPPVPAEHEVQRPRLLAKEPGLLTLQEADVAQVVPRAETGSGSRTADTQSWATIPAAVRTSATLPSIEAAPAAAQTFVPPSVVPSIPPSQDSPDGKASEKPAAHRLLGLPLPDALPSGEAVARRVRGWGEAVTGLIP